MNVPPGCSFHTRCPHVMDICSRVDPVLVETGSGHVARCHLFEQPPELVAQYRGELIDLEAVRPAP